MDGRERRFHLMVTMQRHPVASFFVLAYALSWSIWIPMYVTGQIVRQGDATPTHVPGLLGPFAAALIVTGVTRGRRGIRDLFARMVRWRVPLRWYLVAVSPVALFGAAAVASAATGRGWPALSDLGRFSGMPLIGVAGVFVLLFVVNAFGEEAGWRGFAVPELQKRYSPLRTSLIVGLLWALWHVPSMFVIQNYRDLGATIVPAFTLGIVAGSILLTWLYNESGGSILVVSLWHATYNLVGGTAAAKGLVAAFVSTGVMVWAAYIVLWRWPRARKRRTPNGFVLWLLRSPFHRVIDGAVMQLSIFGRRTGRNYVFPVQYARDRDVLWVLPGDHEHKTWWRNLVDGEFVHVRLDGRDYVAHASVLFGARDPQPVATAMRVYMERFPRAARGQLPLDDAVIVKVVLDAAEAERGRAA